MDDITVHVDAEVNPTESEDKVRKAIENMFGKMHTTAKPLKKGSILIAEAHGKEPLTNFCSLLRREHIRAAARAVLLEGLYGNTLSFCLNKQVAYAGHISFATEVAESPLGPIRVKIQCENPRELVHWLTSTAA